jgi:hypothetical protein
MLITAFLKALVLSSLYVGMLAGGVWLAWHLG